MNNEFNDSSLPDVLEPSETDFYNKNESFSHEALAMMCYKKAIDSLAQELTVGYWETKTDKYGNMLRAYKPDGRLTFINCIKTLCVVLSSDFDKTAKDKVEETETSIKGHYQLMAGQEHARYIRLPIQQRNNVLHIEGKLNQDLHYYQHHINFTVEEYIKLFKELELLLKRTKYFRKELNVA